MTKIRLRHFFLHKYYEKSSLFVQKIGRSNLSAIRCLFRQQMTNTFIGYFLIQLFQSSYLNQCLVEGSFKQSLLKTF